MKYTRIEFGFGIELDANGKTIDADSAMLAKCSICVRAAERFGGYTWANVDGGWVDKADGRFFQERAATLAVLFPGDVDETAVHWMAGFIKSLLNQRAVFVVRSTIDAELL